jgi:hypothetical protein
VVVIGEESDFPDAFSWDKSLFRISIGIETRFPEVSGTISIIISEYHEKRNNTDTNYYDQFIFFIQWGRCIRTAIAGPY